MIPIPPADEGFYEAALSFRMFAKAAGNPARSRDLQTPPRTAGRYL
jgi:hypothetical protein